MNNTQFKSWHATCILRWSMRSTIDFKTVIVSFTCLFNEFMNSRYNVLNLHVLKKRHKNIITLNNYKYVWGKDYPMIRYEYDFCSNSCVSFFYQDTNEMKKITPSQIQQLSLHKFLQSKYINIVFLLIFRTSHQCCGSTVLVQPYS